MVPADTRQGFFQSLSALGRSDPLDFSMNDGDAQNQQMVDRMIADGSLWSPAVIAALRATPRHRFLDRVFIYQRKREQWREIITRDPSIEDLHLIYSDRALITSLAPRGQMVPI